MSMGDVWLTRLFVVVLFVGLAKGSPLIGWVSRRPWRLHRYCPAFS